VLLSYARVSTEDQDATAQLNALSRWPKVLRHAPETNARGESSASHPAVSSGSCRIYEWKANYP
jgi:DNA invertase Pin-like site-specific DNA recombinase